MDAVEYLKTLCRMCNCECCNCEIREMLSAFETCTAWRKNHPDEAVAIVEKWAKEHPVKTRQSEFLKQWPDAALTKDGVVTVCPLEVSAAYRKKNGNCAIRSVTCPDCKRQFWSAEVEE